MGINRAVVSGNLTRDPERRETPEGTKILSFGIAVNDRVRDRATGEWTDRPNFIDCAMFGPRAEAIAPYLAKGSKVCLEGRLRYSSWDENGTRRSKVSLVVDGVELMGGQRR